jgi:hypothetical protein
MQHEGTGTRRIRYADGEVLASSALRHDTSYESRARRLHVATMHRTWGVAVGLSLSLSEDHRKVLVTPGLAYDCFGRELLLGDTIHLDHPEPAADATPPGQGVDLVIRLSVQTGAVPGWPKAVFACDGTNPARFNGQPEIRWGFVDQHSGGGQVRLGLDVPLGRFLLDADGTLSGPDLDHRRAARSLTRPHVGFGIAQPPELSWEFPFAGYGRREARLDTTSAAFSKTPFYFVALARNPWVTDDLVVGPFVSVAEPAQTHFRLQLFFFEKRPLEGLSGMQDRVTKLADQASVFWLGVQPTDAS